MLRTRSEAEQIAAKYGDVGPRWFEYLVMHYLFVRDWACNNCHKTGMLIRFENGEPKTSSCICVSIRKRKTEIEKLTDSSNLPRLYRTARFEDWLNVGVTQAEIEVNNKSIQLAISYAGKLSLVMEKGWGLYLAGPNGVGKTFVACCIANRALASGYSTKYYTMDEVIRREVQGWHDSDAAVMIRAIKDSKLLIIDDIEKVYRSSTGLANALFDNLLRHRLQSKLPCIFTSNATMLALTSEFGNNVTSMLTENCAELIFSGKDFRRNMSSKIIEGLSG